MSVAQEISSLDHILHEMSLEEALALWKTLPAPQMDEVSGEYVGQFHDGGDAEVNAAKTKFFLQSPCGYWLGKAYHPGEGGHGEGYNYFRDDEGNVQRFRRFATETGPSLLDGRPSLIMYYRAFNNYAGKMDLTDEIRRLDDGTYLCMYTGTETVPGFCTKKPGEARSEPELFALTGPAGPWVGADDPQREIR